MREDQNKEPSYYSLFHDIVQPATLEDIKRFWKQQQFDAIMGVVLVLGLMLIPFNYNMGGVVVGLILGFYLSKHFLKRINGFPLFYKEEGGFKSYVSTIGSVAAFLLIPGLMTSVVIGMLIRHFTDKRKIEPLEQEKNAEQQAIIEEDVS